MFGGNNTTCPYCKEKIKKNATKCKHCGEWLSEPQSFSDNNVRSKENVSSEAESFSHGNESTVSKAEDLKDKNDGIRNVTSSEHVKTVIKVRSLKPAMFSKSFTFSGRIRRREYVLSTIFSLLFYIIVAIVSVYVQISELLIISLIPMLWFIFAQGTKRCHDAGFSGLFQFIPLLSVYVLFFADSVYGSNIYGTNPKGMSSNLEKAAEYYNRGFENRMKKKYNEALSDYKKALELDPDDINTYNNLAYCLLEMKKHEEAKKYFNKCLEFDADHVDSLIGISILNYENDNINESILWMKKAISKEPILKERMPGLKKLEMLGFIYNEENKQIIKKIFEAI